MTGPSADEVFFESMELPTVVSPSEYTVTALKNVEGYLEDLLNENLNA